MKVSLKDWLEIKSFMIDRWDERQQRYKKRNWLSSRQQIL